MTSKEIEELKEKLNRIGCMEACISAAERNIDTFNRVFDVPEVCITNGGNPIYLSGIEKTEIYELLVQKQNDIIAKYKLELENLK